MRDPGGKPGRGAGGAGGGTGGLVGRGGRRRVGGTVVALGTVSLLTDISAEMVTAVLPVYLTLVLGLSPLAYGLIDGIYQGVTVLVRLAGGYVADRFNRPKAVCGVGYGLSAVTKLGLLAAGSSAVAIGAVIAVDRTGKGLRTAPRDALIAGSVAPGILGRAFGVHRAMDTTGALLGPVVAFALLAALPGEYDPVFVLSFAIAVLGWLALWAFVPERRTATGERPAPPRLAEVAGLLRRGGLRRVAVVSAGLALLTIGDGFIYLVVLERGAVGATYFPLLFIATAAVYLALAVPLGRLADRIGRTTVLVGGHVALLGCYAALLAPLPEPAVLALSLALLGGYYAATDGVLAAVASGLVSERMRATGIALVQTAVAAGRLLSAGLFGLLWTITSRETALLAFGAALLVALPVAARMLRTVPR